MPRTNARLAAIILPLLLTVSPAPAYEGFMMMSAKEEARIGAQEHPKLVAEFGGKYDNAKLTSYVTQLGVRLGKASREPETPYTFTVLNSDVANAFALPGGYVHISRGLMAMMNSESELASVLGHEIGHVTAHHAAKRQRGGLFGQLATIGVAVATGNEAATKATSLFTNVGLLRYSRKQESQSDRLGIENMMKLNYDPNGAVKMLEGLDAISKLAAAETGKTDNTPTFFRTHPVTTTRIKDAKAAIAKQGVPATAKEVGRDRYLAAIDGMIYGDDPREGVIRGQEFLHPGMKFALTAPTGYTLQNTPEAVLINGPSGARSRMGITKIADTVKPEEAIVTVWRNMAGADAPQLTNIAKLDAKGMSGLTGITQLNDPNGNSADVRLTIIRFDPATLFTFVSLAQMGTLSSHDPAFIATARSLRKLTDQEVAGVKGLRLRVVTVKSGDTIASLSARMATGKDKAALFRALNALGSDTTVKAGDKVKLVLAE